MNDLDLDALKRSLAEIPALIDISRWGVRRLQIVTLVVNEQIVSPDGWAYLSTKTVADALRMRSDRYVFQLMGAAHRDRRTNRLAGGSMWRTEWVLKRQPGRGSRPAGFRVNPDIDAWRLVDWWEPNPMVRRHKLAPLLFVLEREAEGSVASRPIAKVRGDNGRTSFAMHREGKGSNRGVRSATHREANGAYLRDASRRKPQKASSGEGLSFATHRGGSDGSPRAEAISPEVKEVLERDGCKTPLYEATDEDVATLVNAVLDRVRSTSDNNAFCNPGKRAQLRQALADVELNVLLDAVAVAPATLRLPALVDWLGEIARGDLTPGVQHRMGPEAAANRLAELQHTRAAYLEAAREGGVPAAEAVPDWIREEIRRCEDVLARYEEAV